MRYAKKIVAFIAACYILCLLYWMFIGFGRAASGDETMRYNLLPFATINNYFIYYDHYNWDTWIINIGGNIGVFMPIGFSLPIIFGWRFKRAIISFVLFISVLEVLQLITRRGSLDVDDILLNTVGAAIGYGIYEWLSRKCKAARTNKMN